MIVRSKLPGIFTQGLHLFKMGKDGNKEAIPNKMKNVRFMPGVNEIADADWEECKTHKVVQHHTEKGDLIEQDNRPIQKRSEKLAVTLVKDTFDVELLTKWHEDDSRPEVRKAISVQLKECTLSDEDRKMLKGEQPEE
jgi:hypothetical protein